MEAYILSKAFLYTDVSDWLLAAMWRFLLMWVRKSPGWMTLTGMFHGASSMRSVSENLSKALLAAEYTPRKGRPNSPAMLEMLMIFPERCARMWGMTWRMTSKGAKTLVRNKVTISSVVV